VGAAPAGIAELFNFITARFVVGKPDGNVFFTPVVKRLKKDGKHDWTDWSLFKVKQSHPYMNFFTNT
jgi:hypothetical protein